MGDNQTTSNCGNNLILCVPDDSPEDGDLYGGFYECPVCGEQFDDDTWVKGPVGGDPWGGQANFDCPNDCEGSVSVKF